MGGGFEALAEAVLRRRDALELRQTDLEVHGGPSGATVRNVERAARGKYASRTYRQLEAALRWQPGTVDKILSGEVGAEEAAGLPHRIPLPDGRGYATVEGDLEMLPAVGVEVGTANETNTAGEIRTQGGTASVGLSGTGRTASSASGDRTVTDRPGAAVAMNVGSSLTAGPARSADATGPGLDHSGDSRTIEARLTRWPDGSEVGHNVYPLVRAAPITTVIEALMARLAEIQPPRSPAAEELLRALIAWLPEITGGGRQAGGPT